MQRVRGREAKDQVSLRIQIKMMKIETKAKRIPKDQVNHPKNQSPRNQKMMKMMPRTIRRSLINHHLENRVKMKTQRVNQKDPVGQENQMMMAIKVTE